jgi:hypothetical protein
MPAPANSTVTVEPGCPTVCSTTRASAEVTPKLIPAPEASNSERSRPETTLASATTVAVSAMAATIMMETGSASTAPAPVPGGRTLSSSARPVRTISAAASSASCTR